MYVNVFAVINHPVSFKSELQWGRSPGMDDSRIQDRWEMETCLKGRFQMFVLSFFLCFSSFHLIGFVGWFAGCWLILHWLLGWLVCWSVGTLVGLFFGVLIGFPAFGNLVRVGSRLPRRRFGWVALDCLPTPVITKKGHNPIP